MTLGCGGEDVSSPRDVVVDAAEDVADEVEMETGTVPDAGTLGCEALFDPGFTFALDRDGETTQIHADAVFDGEAVVVVYVSRSTKGVGFDLWLVRATCGALMDGDPVLIASSDEGTIIEPQIAIGPDGAHLLVWQLDDGSGSDNLSIWSRTVGPDLMPTSEAARLALTRGGVENTGNTWMPALATTTSGYALAGAWAHADAERFQVFVQELDTSGAPVGDAIDVELEPEVTQTFPAIAVGGNEIGVVWDRAPDDGETELRRAVVDLESRAVSGHETLGTGAGGAVAHTGVSFVWGGALGGDIVVWRSGNSITLGASGTNVAPVFSVHQTTGALGVVWYRIQSGLRNDLFRYELSLSDDEWVSAVGELVPLDTPAAPYSPVIIEAGPGWFLSWSSGQSPEFELLGRFED